MKKKHWFQYIQLEDMTMLCLFIAGNNVRVRERVNCPGRDSGTEREKWHSVSHRQVKQVTAR